jgi:hypothetical protein
VSQEYEAGREAGPPKWQVGVVGSGLGIQIGSERVEHGAFLCIVFFCVPCFR